MADVSKNEPIDLDSVYAEIMTKLEALGLRVEALEEARYYEQSR